MDREERLRWLAGYLSCDSRKTEEQITETMSQLTQCTDEQLEEVRKRFLLNDVIQHSPFRRLF